MPRSKKTFLASLNTLAILFAMKSLPKPPKPPICYNDLEERLFEIRDTVYAALNRDELLMNFDFSLLKQFQDDASLRETLAEVLLTAILWVEAGRQSAEILQDCVPEIRGLLVYTSNRLLDYLKLKSHTQKEAILSRGSLADAWTHLLVEFRKDLGPGADQWWWKQEQPPFVPNKYFF